MSYPTHVYTHLTILPNPFLSLNFHLPAGSSLKNATWLSPPCDVRHSSFHPGRNSIRPTSHLLRMSRIWNSVQSPSHLLRMSHIRNSIWPASHFLQMSHIRNSIRPTSHLLWMSHIRNSIPPASHILQMSHIRNSSRPTSHLLRMSRIRNYVRPKFRLSRCLTSGILSADVPPSSDVSHSEFCPADVPPSLDISHSTLDVGWERGRFNFPRQTCPDPLMTLTQRASAADNSDSPDSLARQTLAIRRIHFCPQSKSKL